MLISFKVLVSSGIKSEGMGGGVPGELELYLYVLFHLCLRENNRDRTECKKKGGGKLL